MDDEPVKFEEPVRPRHEPQEIRIYVKQLRKALKFLPLGSRAYYYLSGEIVRAGAELRKLEGFASGSGSTRDNQGPPSRSKNEGS